MIFLDAIKRTEFPNNRKFIAVIALVLLDIHIVKFWQYQLNTNSSGFTTMLHHHLKTHDDGHAERGSLVLAVAN